MCEEIIASEIKEGIYTVLSYLPEETATIKSMKKKAQMVSDLTALTYIHGDAKTLHEAHIKREKAKAKRK